jgi:hypothetical protein
MIAAPMIMAAPFAFGFPPAAALVAVLIGVVLLGLALQAEGPDQAVPLSAHAGFDYLLAIVAGVAGLAIAVVTGEWYAGAFLVGVGAALATLTASTRFTVARSA